MRDKVYIGDCRTVLPTLPEKSVQCCVTSPPYFGLRDYGHTDQIGLEQTPDEYVAQLVAVFREVRRVLRDDGTLWLNIGDSYSGSGKGPAGNLGATHNERHLEHKHSAIVPDGLKPKDLIGIPWRVAFALQADGWYLRQDIIWHKPNPMPESVTDRCTKAHEYLFLLSKSAQYFYDSDSIKEQAIYSRITGMDGSGFKPPQDFNGKHSGGSEILPQRKTVEGDDDGTRNRRSVWTVPTQPYSGAHFAVFPPALIEPCILAGCPSGGTVLDPFFGSGTTGEVCERRGRHWIGIELNKDYAELHERTKQQGLSL